MTLQPGDQVEVWVEAFDRWARGEVVSVTDTIAGRIIDVAMPEYADCDCSCTEACPPDCAEHYETKIPHAIRFEGAGIRLSFTWTP